MGELTRKGEFRAVTQQDLEVNDRARAMQALHEVPVLQRAGNPHEHLFFALFDGTGQDVDNPRQSPTNVGALARQAEVLSRDPSNRMGLTYIEGVGTQDDVLVQGLDKMLAFSWDEKLEEAYRDLSRQTWEWQQQDPDAQVRVASVGYSRGAVLAAGLARLVDEYGIAHPTELKFGRDANGNVAVQSDRPPLVEPGNVAQALGLYDPVGTSFPEGYDARRPPSVISAVTLAANDEGRRDFAHQAILQPGLSEGRRFANLLVPGGHSNVGGGNRDAGLEAMHFNTMADYLNALRDEPIFAYRALPDDPAQYTVFQARGPSAIRGMDTDTLRDLRTELANCKVVDPCRDGEPMDQALAAQFTYRAVHPSAPVPTLPGLSREAGNTQSDPGMPHAPRSPAEKGHPDNALFEKLREGVRQLDTQAGKGWDAASDQISAMALVAAKGKGFTGQDDLQLAFNVPTERHAGGEILHIGRMGSTGSSDPAENRAHFRTEEALRTPVEDSYRQLDQLTQTKAQIQRIEQQDLQRQQSEQQAMRISP